MKNKLTILFFFFQFLLWGQNPELAQKYFDNGDFEKAAYAYQLLLDKFPYKQDYFYKLINSLQAIKKYNEAEKIIKSKNPQSKPQYWVVLGYNYQLQKDSLKAQKYYQKAIKSVAKKTYFAYSVAESFKKYYLLDEALQTYQVAIQNGSRNNFYMQMALIYAEKNNSDLMFDNFLKLLSHRPDNLLSLQFYLSKYITQNPENKNNQILKNKLIEKIKETQEAHWYRLLQWLYTQQKEYKKAFLQIKSLYRKGKAEISEIYQLATTARNERKTKEARSIYRFIISQNLESEYAELSKLALLQMDISFLLNEDEKQAVHRRFQTYLSENWSLDNFISLQILYADFLAFHQGQTSQALDLLEQIEKQNLTRKQLAEVRLKKADILLHNKMFNQALILYTQVQLDFPNHPIGYKATYYIARASFFQGDIDWAHSQLKIIKSVASDLIANDAIDLDVTIINNKEENDSLQTGLKKFATAKFEIFRKKPEIALKILDTLKTDFKGQLIYDNALWEQGQIYEKQGKLKEALQNYQAIIEHTTEDLLVDDTYFRMAMIYKNQGEIEKAKNLFKKIIVDYPASFWFVDAQKYFRKLRNEAINEP